MKVYTIVTRYEGWNSIVHFANLQEARSRIRQLEVSTPSTFLIHGPIEQDVEVDPDELPQMNFGHESDGFYPDLTPFARQVARQSIEERVNTEDEDGKLRAPDDIYSDAFVVAMHGLVDANIFDPESTYPAEKDMEEVAHDEAQRVMYPWSPTVD